MVIPVITFGGATSGFGALEGWEIQSSGSNIIYDRVAVLGTGGNEINQKLFNQRTEVTTTYKSDLSGSAPTIPASLGALVNSLILTSINITTINNAFTLGFRTIIQQPSLCGHRHH